MDNFDPLDTIRTALGDRVTKDSGDSFMARCPAHDDHNASLSVGRGDKHPVVVKCHAGCTPEAVVEALGLTKGHLMAPTTTKKTWTVVAQYDYTGSDGTLLYQVERSEKRDFRQRRPDGCGGWAYNLKGVRRVPYRLHQLAEDRPSTIFVVEGEKDADNLAALGLMSTTNSGGAGKWSDNHTQAISSCGVQEVLIIPDSDDAGRRHGVAVATSVAAFGLTAKIFELPNVSEKGDVSDWLAVGGTKDELLALAEAAPVWIPTTTTTVCTVDLADQLNSVRAFIRRFVHLDNHQATAATLWTAHTHVIDAFDATPYLQITSATPEAGKTRLLEVLAGLVNNAWLTQRTSAAVLVRKIDAEQPTLLLDESDAAFGGDREYAEALRGVLNAGYRRSGKASLCVGQGAKISYRDFSTFCPKAIAGIGKLPDTVVSRAIRIELRRRTKDEPVEKFRERDAKQQSEPIRETLVAWASTALDTLREARPMMPDGLRDRAEDVWEALFAVADLAGGDWPTNARAAAIALSGSPIVETDLGTELLRDMHVVFGSVEWLATADIVDRLVALEERPWATYRRGDKPINAEVLARWLKPFGVVPVNNGTVRGYYRSRFEDPWFRYLGLNPSTRHNPNVHEGKTASATRQREPTTDTMKTEKTPIEPGVTDGLTGSTRDTGAKDQPRERVHL